MSAIPSTSTALSTSSALAIDLAGLVPSMYEMVLKLALVTAQLALATAQMLYQQASTTCTGPDQDNSPLPDPSLQMACSSHVHLSNPYPRSAPVSSLVETAGRLLDAAQEPSSKRAYHKALSDFLELKN
ncbi:uncharacterized protein LOC106179365 [Lingula anatina]|uniref:Uncharacterized protein LOC106179365 n=1 Tax=Lingula anatina TaxID=7574 RepID=A0A1S3K723_LINAN|nr:uncharacterized protein LOC106179365 [Lingula anatina]|eukprot:XP_013418430.1 uncharacterized protein LOC106179365 [Lingula anatina]